MSVAGVWPVTCTHQLEELVRTLVLLQLEQQQRAVVEILQHVGVADGRGLQRM
jgi:hypothetical protein